MNKNMAFEEALKETKTKYKKKNNDLLLLIKEYGNNE